MRFDGGDPHAGGHCAPHLDRHLILAGGQELFDVQILLVPLAVQPNLPSALEQRSNRQRRRRCIVIQKIHALSDARDARLGANALFWASKVLPAFPPTPLGCQSWEARHFVHEEAQIGTKQLRPAGRASPRARARCVSFKRTVVH